MKNESVKKSLEKSKNVLEKHKNAQAKNLHKKDQHVYNNCYELRSRAINQKSIRVNDSNNGFQTKTSSKVKVIIVEISWSKTWAENDVLCWVIFLKCNWSFMAPTQKTRFSASRFTAPAKAV